MIALVLAALVGQAPVADADARFRFAVEDSVRRIAAPRSLDRVLPPREARLVRLLGSRDYRARELASEILAERASVRAIYWAGRSTDAEVRARIEPMIRPLVACGHCAGTGTCPRRTAYYENPPIACAFHVEHHYGCRECIAEHGRTAVPYDWAAVDVCRLCEGTGDTRPDVLRAARRTW